MAYSIEVLSEKNAHLWDGFYRQSREGTLFHSIQWKELLEDALGLKLKYYVILEDQKVMGILPCVTGSARYFRGLDVIPHSECNNIILDDSFDINQINDVLALFSRDYASITFNTYDPTILDSIAYRMLPIVGDGNMVVDLKQNPPDLIWENNLAKDDRYKISRFEKGGFTVREVEQEYDIERFYHHYAENIARINGHVHPLSFFRSLMDAYSRKHLRIVALTNGDLFAGGSLALLHPERKTAYFEYLSLNRNLPNKYSPSYALLWEGINWAWENGYEKISLGRQKLDPDNPPFRNKAKFGAEFVPIHTRVVFFSRPVSLLYRFKKGLAGA
ncbi:MAG: GNAT family N-acetyltransferase [Methanomicrobiaceae archaeon]|uniref:BioF2-like acetyltransferase domain-containing protein n=1 Tax=hydrocarbon metagenome TaxID=938273 RepID=A0A0W8FFV3_9ZZZZ|nr:GNAT family N-acetyltransferase [Methanomicrobiaceae archaeon]